jgi:enediyne biosynthesis thioesterase
MLFDYLRAGEKGEVLVAKGEQQIACMRRTETGVVPTPVPEALRRALEPFL